MQMSRVFYLEAGMGSDLAVTRLFEQRPLTFLLRLTAVLTMAFALSGCISVKPNYPRANYPVSRDTTAPPDRPTVGDQALGKYKIGSPYKIDGVWYVPADQPDYDEVGMASWYGDDFHNKLTANGEMFDMNAYSAAHKTLPMPSVVEVTNLDNGKKMLVRLNDRGPFVGDRIVDLSRAAAVALGFNQQGLAKVRVRYIGPAKLLGPTDVASGNTTAPSQQASAARPKIQISADTLAEQNLPPIPLSLAPRIPVPVPAPLPAPVPTVPMPGISSAPLPPLPMAAASPEPDYSPPAPEYAMQPIAPEPEMPALQAPTVQQPQAQPQAQAQSQTYPPQATGPYQVVVGAFASQVSATNLAQQLGGMGQASIVPVDRAGQTLYRVVVNGLADETQARVVQERAISMGLLDARMVRP